MSDRGDHRIGDAERQQAIDVLRTHTGAGRLSLDEFSDLAGRVYEARTVAELEEVGRSLPPGLIDPPTARPAPVVAPATRPPAPPAPAAGGPPRRRFVGVLGSSRARGHWRPGPDVRAIAFWGGVHLDFRDAELDGPVDVTATAVMGGVTITVAEGTRVEMHGMVLMGGAHNATRAVAPDPGAAEIRVHARGLWGGVTVVSRKTRAQREAAVARAGVDPAALDSRVPGLLELPQRVLEDVAEVLPAILAGPGGRAPADLPRRGRSRGPGRHREHHHGPPAPPWARRDDDRTGAERADAPGPAQGTEPSDVPGAAPAGAAASRPSGTLTMMVTDIVDSTRLAESLGDRRWIGVLSHHNEIVRAEVAHEGGTEVKAQGDGFLVVFPSARRAIRAAIGVQRALARERAARPEIPVDVRIGLHTGEIVDVDGDVLGQNVVVAVRIADRAGPGEIVVSGLTRDLTVSGGDLAFGPADEVELKGLSQPWRVHRVTWAPEGA